MKAYDIAICLIFTLAAVNILSASHFLESDPLCNSAGHPTCDINIYYGGTIANIQNQVGSPDITPPSTNDVLSYPELAISAFGLLIRSLVAIILIFAYSTILLPIFLNQLTLPAEVTATLTLGVWITYAIGYAQYRARSTLSGTE